MGNLCKLKWELILINALLVGVIVFFSAMGTGADYKIVLPSAALAGILRFLIEVQGEIKDELNKIKESRKIIPPDIEEEPQDKKMNGIKLTNALFF